MSTSESLHNRVHPFGVEDCRPGPAAGRVRKREEPGRSCGGGAAAGPRGPDRADGSVVAGHAVQHHGGSAGSGCHAGRHRDRDRPGGGEPDRRRTVVGAPADRVRDAGLGLHAPPDPDRGRRRDPGEGRQGPGPGTVSAGRVVGTGTPSPAASNSSWPATSSSPTPPSSATATSTAAWYIRRVQRPTARHLCPGSTLRLGQRVPLGVVATGVPPAGVVQAGGASRQRCRRPDHGHDRGPLLDQAVESCPRQCEHDPLLALPSRPGKGVDSDRPPSPTPLPTANHQRSAFTR